MDAPTVEPPLRPQIEEEVLAGEEDVPCDAIVQQYLRGQGATGVAEHSPCVADPVANFIGRTGTAAPLGARLAELVTYFSLAAEDEHRDHRRHTTTDADME